jgi:hypothetical protein
MKSEVFDATKPLSNMESARPASWCNREDAIVGQRLDALVKTAHIVYSLCRPLCSMCSLLIRSCAHSANL